MQTRNPFFDDLARFATGAAGVAQGMGEEARAFWRGQMERLIADMDLVPREEFEAMKQLASAAKAESEALAVRVAALEARLDAAPGAAPPAPARKPRKPAT